VSRHARRHSLFLSAHYRGEPGGVLGLSAVLKECGAAPEVKPKATEEGRAAVVALRCDSFLPRRSQFHHQSAERERTAREGGMRRAAFTRTSSMCRVPHVTRRRRRAGNLFPAQPPPGLFLESIWRSLPARRARSPRGSRSVRAAPVRTTPRASTNRETVPRTSSQLRESCRIPLAAPD